ncbi:hypothetical protein ACLI09_07510 [Flavobacterium sp. RHBU_24]|uniref:hypothetical protein n=1 Tax=Flavobacterium sp. RHBU_24 TaxID=3391185 RepID=UPI003984A2B4
MGKKDKIRKKQPVPPAGNILKLLFMAAGILLIVFVVILYRKTIINICIPVGIIFTAAFIAFIARKKGVDSTPPFNGYAPAFMFAILSWGFAACYAFMAINYYAAESEVQYYTFKIEERGSLVGSRRQRERRTPTVTINYFGNTKELVFPHDATQKVNAAQNVKLFVRRGYFGYDIIERKEVY